MLRSVILASVFSDQMTSIERASTTNKIIDAVIVFVVAAVVNIAAQRSDLLVLKWVVWLLSAIGVYILYLTFFR